jgi:Na+/phosphate symporter
VSFELWAGLFGGLAVILVGFISAGLMSMSQSVAVIIGANIGTTITAQILAFKVTKIALPLVAAGFLMSFTSKRENWRQTGILIVMASQGLIELESAIAIALGANIVSWAGGRRPPGG